MMAVSSWKSRVSILGIGLLGNWVMVKAFDFLLYPYVLIMFGLIKGSIIMTVLSFLICWVTLIFYDWAKKDWIGIETLKGIRENNSQKPIARATRWLLQKGDVVVMLVLSIKFDPFITTAYMRKGTFQYNGLSRRDWMIFISSVIVSNVWWTFVAFTGISIVIWIDQKLGIWESLSGFYNGFF